MRGWPHGRIRFGRSSLRSRSARNDESILRHFFCTLEFLVESGDQARKFVAAMRLRSLAAPLRLPNPRRSWFDCSLVRIASRRAICSVWELQYGERRLKRAPRPWASCRTSTSRLRVPWFSNGPSVISTFSHPRQRTINEPLQDALRPSARP